MEMIERDALTVVGLPVRATWQALWEEMPNAWQQLIDRHAEIAHPVGETFVDVSLDREGDEYLQLVGAPVSRVTHVPAGMRAIEIPAQRYIHHCHVGPTSGIADTFGRMYDWAAAHGHDAGTFKLDVGYTADGDEREHDLFIGLLPERAWRALHVE